MRKGRRRPPERGRPKTHSEREAPEKQREKREQFDVFPAFQREERVPASDVGVGLTVLTGRSRDGDSDEGGAFFSERSGGFRTVSAAFFRFPFGVFGGSLDCGLAVGLAAVSGRQRRRFPVGFGSRYHSV